MSRGSPESQAVPPSLLKIVSKRVGSHLGVDSSDQNRHDKVNVLLGLSEEVEI